MSKFMSILGWAAVVLICASALWAIWTAATVTTAGALALTGLVAGILWLCLWLNCADLR